MMNSSKKKKIKESTYSDRFDLGDLFLCYRSTKHEKKRYTQDPYIEIGPNTLISSGVVIGETDLGGNFQEDGSLKIKPYDDLVKIGKNCIIQSNTTIYKGVIINDNVIIRSHCIIHRGARINAGAIIDEDSIVRKNAIIPAGAHYTSCKSCDHKKEGGVFVRKKPDDYIDWGHNN